MDIFQALRLGGLLESVVLDEAHRVGERNCPKSTRAIIDTIPGGTLLNARTETDPAFGFGIVTGFPDVPSGVLRLRENWADKAADDCAAKNVARPHNNNFET